ncbi:MAG TPA: von Willebrand factor type A domain-containing protein [Anseongella sp.]
MKFKLIVLIGVFIASTGFNGTETERMVTGAVTDGRVPLPGVSVYVKGTSLGTITDKKGHYSIEVKDDKAVLVFSFIGFETREVRVGHKRVIDMTLLPAQHALEEVVVVGAGTQKREAFVGGVVMNRTPAVRDYFQPGYPRDPYNTEDYTPVDENRFRQVKNQPLSTFSIDVDAASYSNVRRFLEQGVLPPKDAVRVEELVNYFDYQYARPDGADPVNIVAEIGETPWNSKHRLIHIGLQGKTVPAAELPASNLVFLIDVSGSMQSPNKLPLLKQGFKLLANQLRANDRVAIVTYASQSGVALASTPGNEKKTIMDAIEELRAGGSTAGAAGIRDAYRIAREHFIDGGNNRIILATDGDFNVGVSSDGELQRLIESERESGVFLSVLGFGMGNYKDNKLELLADKGNGNYAYIDTFNEARKVLVSEFGGTLFTIARDVKLQIEFNPKYVEAYRLIGYENRMLNEEDFVDDRQDAGEMGSGHTVTALYEIIPAGAGKQKDRLKYQDIKRSQLSGGNEVLTVKLRYKEPDGKVSREISKVLTDKNTPLASASDNFRFAASVAGFGMLLRDSEFKGTASYDQLIGLAWNARGADREGYRAEFIGLLKTASLLDKGPSGNDRKTGFENSTNRIKITN